MPRRRRSRAKYTPEERRRRRQEFSRLQSLFRPRGFRGRFVSFQSSANLRSSSASISLGRASEYELRELSGHGIVLEGFQADSPLMLSALYAAARVVVEAASKLVPSKDRGSPYSTNALKKSLEAVLGEGFIQVIATGGQASWVTGEAREYGNFVERGGRLPRVRTASGRLKKGRPTRPQPFLEPAFLSTRQQQLEAAIAALRRGLV